MPDIIFIQTGRRLDTDQPFGTRNHGRLLGAHPSIKNHSLVDYGDRIWAVPNSDIFLETPFKFTAFTDMLCVSFEYDTYKLQAVVYLDDKTLISTFAVFDQDYSKAMPLDPALFALCRFADQILVNIVKEYTQDETDSQD